MNTEFIFGTVRATWEAELFFFGFGFITTFLLIWGLLSVILHTRWLKPFWILPGSLIAISIGFFIIMIPGFHNYNFSSCQIRDTVHYNQDVRERWCSYKEDLREDFSEPVFRGFVSER